MDGVFALLPRLAFLVSDGIRHRHEVDLDRAGRWREGKRVGVESVLDLPVGRRDRELRCWATVSSAKTSLPTLPTPVHSPSQGS